MARPKIVNSDPRGTDVKARAGGNKLAELEFVCVSHLVIVEQIEYRYVSPRDVGGVMR